MSKTKAKGLEEKKPNKIKKFLGETLRELKKVITPTKKELVKSTLVVLAFVVGLTLIVTGIDYVVGQATIWVFGVN